MNIKRVTHPFKKHNDKRVAYIMTNTFRVRNNHGLYYALSLSSELDIILYKQSEENPTTNQFFEERIQDAKDVLSVFSNQILYVTNPVELIDLMKQYTYVVKDKGYLREEKAIETVLRQNVQLSLVESNVLVPTHVVTEKEEYSAKTIRQKIWKHKLDFIDPVLETEAMMCGEQEALEMLHRFIEHNLEKYDDRSDPSMDVGSKLSVYLKYGFISPLTILLELENDQSSTVESFLEQLIIRRELAINFVEFNPNYDQFDSITYSWAYQTMDNHMFDNREYLYTLEDYISYNTHDPYFNAAMKEMVKTGYMHNYMRMYWCKKIIEWSPSYQVAYNNAMKLNNYYFRDGNTPNGYTGVAWCFGKHDRAWTERPIFGKLRYMNANGLKRKFDIDTYVQKMNEKVGD